MDPATIAITVAGLLGQKALEVAGGEVGKSAWAAVGRIADSIRARFRGDQEVTESLDRLEAKPASQARTAEVAEVLEQRLEADPQFANELEQLLQEVQRTGIQVQATDAGIVAGGGVTQHAGGDITGRDRIGDQVGGDKFSVDRPGTDR